MKFITVLGLSGCLLLANFAIVAAPKTVFQAGDQILANCHEIYTKGVVQAKVEDGYLIHFNKDSRPIRCPPFRWHSEFVLPFGSVSEYTLSVKGDSLFSGNTLVEFKPGERVLLSLPTNKRITGNTAAIDIEAVITDISSIGAIALQLTSTDPIAVATFWQWVGTNYIDLAHPALAKERQKRAK